MTPQQLMDGLAQKNRELTAKNEELLKLSEAHAQAERDYAVALAQKITMLRMDGESITLVTTLAKGDKVVADLFYRMRIAEGVYKACRERIGDIRSSIDTYRSLLSWLKEEMRAT